jgi:Pretoxin HINT domain
MIQTIDGEKAIEDIKIGDWVLSDDPNTPGGIEYKQVLQTFNHDTTNLVDIFINGEKITTTDTHPFWVQDVGWVPARDLNAGTHLQTKTESWLSIDKVETHTGLTTVYNFEVAGFQTYFVSDVGLLVHNSCPTDPSRPYSNIPDPPNVGLGKDFTRAQKKKIYEENLLKNGGELRSDTTGELLVKPTKSQKGVTPPRNEAQLDHIDPKIPSDPLATPGSNSNSNARLISREENRIKSNN